MSSDVFNSSSVSDAGLLYNFALSATGTNGTEPDDVPDDTGDDTMWLYFFSLMIIMLFHRLVGTVFHRLGIPRIIGDIVAGCMLGPTIMGTSANNWLFPSNNRPIINMFGQFGLIFTSMSAGFAFDARVMQGRKLKIVFYTVLNMSIPALIAIPLYFILPNNANWRGPQFDGPAYFVLVCCAMSSSALPMIFVILSELKVNNDTSRFAIGLSCLSTVGLFTLLSVVAVLSDQTLSKALIVIRLLFLALIFAFLFLVQWLWNHCLNRAKKNSTLSFLRYGSDDMAIGVIALGLISAICSERLGYTFLLGAFLAGAAMPFDLSLRSNLGEKIRWMTRWIFLPQFFVTAGLKFDLRNLKGQSVPYVILFLLLAFAAKAALIPISHYLLKIKWRDAAFCAALANCRGFNALIVAQFGYQYQLIGDSFFITCVLLSIFSTMATGPLAKMFRPDDDDVVTTRSPLAKPNSGASSYTNHSDADEGTGSSSAKGANYNKHRSTSPPLLGNEASDSSSMSPETKIDDVSFDSSGVRIVLPRMSNDSEDASFGSSSDLAFDNMHGGSGSGSGSHDNPSRMSAIMSPEEREQFFSSWLSDSFENKSKVIVVFAEELIRRLRDPHCPLLMDRSTGETRFRGDLFVDYLCAIYQIENRILATHLGQKLLEAGIICPIDTPVFRDKPIQFLLP